MPDLPKPILGNVTAFTINTPDLEKSMAFYEQLGFSLVMRNTWPFPWVQASDGVVLIMLRKDPKPYLALTYYCDADASAEIVRARGITFEQTPKKGDQLRRYLIKSPDGLNISLVGIDGFSQPSGPGMLQMKPEDYFNLEKYINKTTGLFGELAHPVKSLEKSIAFWEKLGFAAVSKFTSPYPWAILSDGLAVIGLHQTTTFSEPAITYFAADMSNKVSALKKAGIKTLKLKDPSNAVVTTPEKQQIFLYQLGGPQTAERKEKKELKAPIIETERLLLREQNPEVDDELFTTFSDEEIITFMGLSGQDDLAIERTKWERGMTTYRMTYKRFFLIEKSRGKVIGACSLHNWYPEHRRAELGYLMRDEHAKNKGYMTEAVKAIASFGFDKMDLNRIEAFTSPDNVPSVKMLSGLGFQIEGTMLQHYFKEGKMHDSVVFKMLKAEYKKAKKSW